MGLNRPSLLLALEPRMMFDGAGVATADAVVDAVPQDTRIPSPIDSSRESRETEQTIPAPAPANQRESDTSAESVPATATDPQPKGDSAAATTNPEPEGITGEGHDDTKDGDGSKSPAMADDTDAADLVPTSHSENQGSKASPGSEGPDETPAEQNDGSRGMAETAGVDNHEPEPAETHSESPSDWDSQSTEGHLAPDSQASYPIEPGPSAEPASADQAADVAHPALPATGDINVREVVFIDTGAADHELLLADLIGNASTDQNTDELSALLTTGTGASASDSSSGLGDGPSGPASELDNHTDTLIHTPRTATGAPDNRDAGVWWVDEVQVVLLDRDSDGVTQISETLAGLQDVTSVHIVSHGATGAVKLGNTWLNRGNVEQYAAQIEAWGDAFAADGDLLFYGCDLAVNTDGRMLIQNLSRLTDTDVAASVDDTGHASLGGNWDLEYRVGNVEDGIVFSTAAQASWQQLLNLSLLVTTDNDVSGSGAPGLNSWTRGEVLEFDDPNLTFDPSGTPANTTDGTFSSIMNLDSLVQDSVASVDALHYVSSAIRVGNPGGGPDSFDLQIGDLLMSTEQAETLVGTNGNLAVGDDDAFVFRPTTTGDYSDGAFYMLLDGAQISGITNIDGLTLVEQTVTVGSSSTLNAGTFLVSEGNSLFDIRHFTADGVGAGTNTQGTLSTLIDGSDINLSSFVRGIELAETELTIGGTTIPEGSILATMSSDDSTVGDNTIDTDQQDIFYITVSQTEWDQSITVANATLLFDGSDVALDTDTPDDDIWGFTFLSSSTTNTLVVDTTDDVSDGNTSSIDNLIANRGADGKISLREALEATNNTPNGATPDQIQFNISTSDSGYVDPDGTPGNGDEYWSIAVDPAGLPTLSDPVVVDATTQPGYSGNPVIELDGAATPAASGINGIRVQTDDSVVKGFVVHSFADEGIEIDGSSGFGDNNVIQNNWVGVDAEGNVAANAEFQLMVSDDADGNQIGGSGANEGNVIVAAPSGFSGVVIRRNSGDNILEGNFIGVLPDGITAAGNSEHGILIQFSADNTRIGGTAAGAGNIISGNTQDGIHIDGTTDATYTTVVDGTLVQGNYIGTNSAATAALGNGDDGVSVQNGATDTVIGGDTAAERNIISGNLGAGVYVTSTTTTGTLIQGNYIGTDINGTADLGNGGVGADSGVRFWNAGTTTVGGVNSGEGNIIAYSGRFGVEVGGSSSGISILGNTIFSNDGIGIDLDGGIEDANLVTDNDVGDGDGGANNLQNYPALTSAVTDGSSTITIDGTLDTDGTNQDYRIEFFANTTADGSGHGEGQRYLGFTTVTTNGSGDASFSAAIAATVAINEHITVTATVDNGSSYGDTSEFAQNILSTNDPPALDLDADDSSGQTGADFAATFTEDGGPVAVADVDATLSDVDDTNLESLTVTITNLLDGADEVLAAVTAGTSITASYAPGTGVLTLTGTDTKANYRQVLRSVTYNNTSQSPNTTARVVTFVANDGINDSNTGTTTVTIASQNDPPVMTTSGGNTGYTEQAAAVVIDAGVTLADPDGFDGTDPSDQYVGVIQITGNYDSNDILGFVDTANIQGNRVGDMLTLTVRSGQTATVAEFETALQSVTFFNGDDDPSALNRTVSFSFDDGIDSSNIATKTVTVTPVNDAPTVSLANTTTSLPENTDTSSRVKVADIVVSDDSQGTNTLSLSGTDAALFEIIGTELFIQAGTALDFETNSTLDVTVEVDDTGVGATPDDTAALAISITDVNEPPSVSLANTTTTLPEDTDTSSRVKVADIVVTDDALGTNTLSLSGTDAALFEIIGTELFIQAGTSLDFETNPSLDVTVEVDDTAVGSTPDDTAALAISITDVNEPPSVSLANTTTTLPEDTDTSARVKVADIVVTDDALGTNTLSLSGADSALFEIIGTELFIQAGTTLDFETNPTLDVTVEVDDTAVGSTPDDTAALAISITDVNEPPTVSLANTTTTLAEDTDTSSRVKVADVVITDDALGTNTLSLSGADAALFEIIGTELFIQAGTSLDFETNPSLDIIVEVDDTAVGSTPDDTVALAITITDVNEPPSVSLANTTTTLPEDTDTSSRVKVADIVVTDDALGTNTLSLSGTDAALFEIIGTELFIQAGTTLDFETNPTLDVTVEVDDTAVGATPDDTATLAISITDANDPPSVALANTTTTLPEDTDTSSRIKVADIVVTDDAIGTNTLALSGADAALFEIIGTELFIQAGTTLDFETNSTLDVTVEVDDTGVGATPDDAAALAITITDVNEPPSVSLANTTTTLPEDTDTSSRVKVADIVIIDDALGTNTLALSGSDAALFEIIGTELFIQAGTALDFETNPTLDVTVEIDDTAVGSTPDDTAALAITITDANEPPTVSLANTTTTLTEDTDTSSRVKVADIVITDDAIGTNTLALSGADAALFEIIGTELFIQAGTTLDFETNPTLDVTVEVDDTAVGSTPDDTAALAITITDVNEPPSVSLANTTTTLPEDTDTSSRVKVADIVITDDALGTNTLALSGTDAALFEIIGTELFIQAGAALDFETNPTLDVTVEVDDTAVGSTPDDTAALAITITDVNEPPSVSLANTTTTLPENTDTSSRVKVADIVITDDALGTNTLALSGTDAALFEIIGTELFIQAGTALDFETNPTLDVTVEVDDTAVGSTPDDTAGLAISITDVNEPPSVSLANTTTTLPEDTDTSSRVKVADIVITDDALGTNTLSLSGTDAALFEIIGTELFIQAGTALDFETNPTLDVTVEVDDTAVGATPDDTAALAITITDVNEPPSVSLANTTTTLPEDTDTSSRVKVADIVVTDDALGTNTLALSGADAALFEIIGTELFIQAGTTLDFETNPTLDVTVEVDDTSVGSTPDDTAALAITITDANDPPSVSLANTTSTLPEDADTSSRIKVADIVVTDDAIGTNTLALSGTDAALFEIIGTELFIQAGTALDFETNPTLDVTVEVDDTAVGSTPDDTAALAISITDVNEPPSVSLANTTTTLPEDTDTSSRVKVADIVITDDALGTNTLVLSGTDAALFEIIGTELFIQAGSALDFETNPTLNVTVEVDDTAVGSTPDDTAALAITITDVNEPPSVSLANTTTNLPEDTDTSSRVKVADIVITDDALGTNTLALSGTDAALFEIIGTELFIQAGAALDFETNPTLDVTVEVDDTAVGSTPDDTAALAITITDVNEPPSVSLANTTTTLPEDTDTSSRVKVADIVVTDDAIGTNTLALSGTDAALFEIIGTELFIQAGTALDFETNPTLDVTVEVDDTAVGSTPDDTATLAISITDVNEPPSVSLANTTTTLPEDTDTSSRVKVADIVITDDALGTNTLSLSGTDATLFEIIGTELFIQAGTTLDFETNPALDVTVEVDDTAVGSTPDDTAALAITITDVNEPPSVSLANTTTTLPEDTDTSSRVKVADIVVTDDALGTNTLALSGADAALFEIIGTELFIQAGTTLDFETNSTLDITVEVDDTGVGATPDDTAALAISITDVNEPPSVSLANTTTTLPEDTDTSSRVKVADIVVTDDALGTNTLALSGADAALFEIIGTELFVQAGTALDFETNPTLNVTVEVDDTAVGSTPDDTAALAITITDVNEPPSVSLANTTTTLPEDTDTSSRVKVSDIVVTDDALGTNTLSLSGTDAVLFEIIGTELFIQAGTALDFETNPTLDVTVEVDDTGVGATPDDSAALAISVTDVNEPPSVSLANTTTTLPEDTDTSSRVKVADIVVTDDALGTNTLSLSGTDAALFEIVGTELFIQAGATLDFETKPTLDVTVEVDDTAVGATPDDTATLAITITDVNEPPTVSLTNVVSSLAENTDTTSRVKIADIIITDDALGTNTLFLTGADAAVFEIVGSELFLRAGTALNSGIDPSLEVIINVDDAALAPTPDDNLTLTVDITRVNRTAGIPEPESSDIDDPEPDQDPESDSDTPVTTAPDGPGPDMTPTDRIDYPDGGDSLDPDTGTDRSVGADADETLTHFNHTPSDLAEGGLATAPAEFRVRGFAEGLFFKPYIVKSQLPGLDPNTLPVLSLSNLAMPPISTLQIPVALFDMLDQLKVDIDHNQRTQSESFSTLTVAISSTVALSVGYVAWLLRFGALAAAVASITPIWREFDPLPILSKRTPPKKDRMQQNQSRQETQIDRLFEQPTDRR